MLSPLAPREAPYEAYWHFAAERQRIFFCRQAGEPGPWTSDPILQNNKFCNAYRASDRVSQFLINNVIYTDLSPTPEDTIFRTLLFRLFNRIETWALVLDAHDGTPEWRDGWPQRAHLSKLLTEARNRKQAVFGGAYMIPPPGGVFGRTFEAKHDGYLELVNFLMQQLLPKVHTFKSLKGLYEFLHDQPLIGNFMAYQLATDLNYSDIWQFDENSFTMAGPGAERGIEKCFAAWGPSYEHVIMWMVDHQEQELRHLGYDPTQVWLWGRPLKAIDCQNLFCETDKYCRVKHPALTSNRTKIKARFGSPNPEKIQYFYPPHWQINHLIGVNHGR